MNRPLPSRTGSAEHLDHDGRHRNWSHGPRHGNEHGEQGEQNMHRPRWARQEKSNLRVSDSVASPCCKLLISLNLARAWELAPIPQSCLARVSSNPTRRDLSLPTLFNNERYPGAQQLPPGQCCCLVASGQIRLEWSRTQSRLSHNETDVEGPMCAPTDRGASFVPGGPSRIGT